MPTVLAEWWPVLALLATLVVAPLLRWGVRSGLPTREDLNAEAAARAQLEKRLSSVELQLQHMPTLEKAHELVTRITELTGELKVVRAEFGTLHEILERVEGTVKRHETIIADAARAR